MGKAVADFFWPKGGWKRGFHYVKHRLRRLPDPPHRIARGIFAGVLVSFSPLFGFHFFVAAFLAWVMRGNILASLLATFFGNPITFPFIAITSFQTGHFLLGLTHPGHEDGGSSIMISFLDAGRDFKDNLYALFTDADADWTKLGNFYDEVFLPYLIGGIIPGLIAATVCYYFSLPLIQAYKNRRKGRLKAKFAAIKEKAAHKAEAAKKHD